MRVVIAARGARTRRATADEVAAAPEVEVVDQAADTETAIDLARADRPDVLLIDEDLPYADAIEACRRLAAAGTRTRVLVLRASSDTDEQYRLLMAGASGVLSSELAAGRLRRAILTLAGGGAAISSRLAKVLVDRYRAATSQGQSMRPIGGPLSQREWEVLDELSAGAGTKEVAVRLGILPNTVYSHLRSIYRKLGVSSREAAVEAAQRMRSGAGVERRAH